MSLKITGPSPAALSATYVPVKASVQALLSAGPLYIAHRGGANVYPEETMEAFRAVVAAGAKAIEPDCWLLKDGALAVNHDSTVDRTSTSSGNVEDHTSASWSSLTLDAGNFLGGTWPNTLRPVLLGDVLREFGNKVVIVPEAKNAGSGAAILAALQRYGIAKDAVIVSSFISAELAPLVAAGYMTMLAGDALDPVATKAAGHAFVTCSNSVSSAYVASLTAVGLKPIIYTVDRRYERDLYLGYGAVGFYSDDPLYLAGVAPKLTSDPFASKTFYHGHLAPLGRGSFSSGRFEFFGNNANLVLQGWACPITPTSYTITVPITFDALGNDATRWPGLGFGYADDRVARVASTQSYEGGYLIAPRLNGTTAVFKTNGTSVATLAAGPTFTAPSAGGTIILTVVVTPTQFSVAINGGTPVTYVDSTYRGGYMHLGKNDNASSGLNVSFGGATKVSVT